MSNRCAESDSQKRGPWYLNTGTLDTFDTKRSIRVIIQLRNITSCHSKPSTPTYPNTSKSGVHDDEANALEISYNKTNDGLVSKNPCHLKICCLLVQLRRLIHASPNEAIENITQHIRKPPKH